MRSGQVHTVVASDSSLKGYSCSTVISYFLDSITPTQAAHASAMIFGIAWPLYAFVEMSSGFMYLDCPWVYFSNS